ncbi:hypothetical protein [Nocardioides lijunqiniae]|uniref:hypothetical protein n=1 Tax=Nocardioides lijunqiniae TaxID=2760832 RepID=UPI001878DA26|nr:hypothetical protein [Nocardioides lijunqiniae]
MSLFRRSRKVRLRHHSRIEPPGPGLRLLSVSPTFDGRAVCAWTAAETRRLRGAHDGPTDLPYGASSEVTQAVITTHGARLDTRIDVSALLPSYPTVQPLPDGRVAWIGARSAWTPEGVEPNALVFDDTGGLLQEACVGDGIEHAQTTPSGRLWLGFSDEGVFGNMGWGSHSGPPPLGRSGIVRCGADLSPQWTFPTSGPPPVDACYALNVDGEIGWAYYYSGFPIVRIDGDDVTVWPTTVGGAKALVTDGTRAALVGGYRSERQRIVTGLLETTFVESGRAKIALPDGSPVPDAAQLDGRGDQLHVFVGQHWYRVDLSAMC